MPSDVGQSLGNFTSDWNDGVVLGALVETYAPGSCPEWRSFQPEEALSNTIRAMKAAEESMGVGKVNTQWFVFHY